MKISPENKQKRQQAWGMIFSCVAVLLFSAVLASAGVYTSTKHGTSADRRDIDADFPYTTLGVCAHCHDQHTSINGTEPIPPTGEGASTYTLFRTNYGATNRNEFCFACHETFTLGSMPLGYGAYGIYQGKVKYNASIHKTDANMDWTGDASPPGPPFSPTSSLVDPGNCHNCHNPHGTDNGSGSPIQQMLFAPDTATASGLEMGCEGCHDGTQGGATKNIRAQLNKTYDHPTHSYSNRHTLPESGSASFGPANRHAECVDCHNPHTVVSGTNHTAGTTGNAVSDVLKYVWGVEPTWTSIWTQPTAYTERKPPTYPDGSLYEYQICFKCHTRYGLGADSDGTANDGIYPSITPVTAEGIVTDQALEFNPNNRSAHPVVVSANNQTGSGTPKALQSTWMNSPWTSVGTQTMYCSDCHGADNESSAAKGPHGSSRRWMLKGTNQYWPFSSSGKLFSLNDISGTDRGQSPFNGLNSTWASELFCLNCHNSFPSSNKSTWRHPGHQEHDDRDYRPFGSANHNVYCVACHSAVPHGSRRSRLIAYGYNGGYGVDAAPHVYTSGGNIYNALRGFKKATNPSNYDKPNCYSTINGCTDHNSNDGGYDN